MARRRTAGVVAALVFATGAVVGLTVWLQHDKPDDTAHPEPRASPVQALDIGELVPLTGVPGELAAGPSGLWALTYLPTRGKTLLEHVDPRSRSGVGKPLVLGRSSTDAFGALVVGARDVWVTHYPLDSNKHPSDLDGTVLRVDVGRNKIVARIPVDHNPAGLALTRDGVWVTSELDDTLARIDPSSNRVVFSRAVGDGPEGIVAAAGSIWVNDAIGDTAVDRIDQSSGAIEARFHKATLSLVDSKFAWLTTSGPPNGQLRRVDLDTNQFTGPIYPLPILPIGLVTLKGRLWMGKVLQQGGPFARGPFIGTFVLYRFDSHANETSGAGLAYPGDSDLPVVANGAFWFRTTKHHLVRVDPAAIP